MKTSIQKYLLASFLFLFFINTISATDSIIWKVDNLDTIGGFPVTVVGNPKIIEAELGLAIEFDGIDDGLFLNTNPVAGADSFTVEIIFKPYAGGGAEQRFLHIQQDDNNRMLIELRSTNTDQWYIDTFIKSGSSNKTLVEPNNLHPNAEWHSAALIYENGNMRHYIDGELELSGTVNYVKQTSGITSLGVRQNKVSWYKGAIQKVRVTHSALLPNELLKVKKTNTAVPNFEKSHIDIFELKSVFFPNTNEIAILKLEVTQAGNFSANIYTLNGQKITQVENQRLTTGQHEIPINFTQFPTGLYLVVATLNGKIQTQKIQVVR